MARGRALVAGLAGAVAVAGGVAFWALRVPPYPLPALAGQLVPRELAHAGEARRYLLYVPPVLADPVPVVIVLHGSAASGERMRRASAAAFDELADRDGVLVVYPDGVAGHWHDCRTSGDNPARAAGADDVGYLRALVAGLDADPLLGGRRIDPAGVFAFGLSNGGQMALRLALEAPDFVAGVAAVAASLPADGNSDCVARGAPVPVLLVNGDADPISPYAGGTVTVLGPFGARGEVRSAPASAAWFARVAGHTDDPFEHRYPDEDPGDGTVATRQVWAAPGRAEVALITIHGGGHTIPHPRKSFPRVFGRTGHDLSAAEEAWRFFRRQAAAEPAT